MSLTYVLEVRAFTLNLDFITDRHNGFKGTFVSNYSVIL